MILFEDKNIILQEFNDSYRLTEKGSMEKYTFPKKDWKFKGKSYREIEHYLKLHDIDATVHTWSTDFDICVIKVNSDHSIGQVQSILNLDYKCTAWLSKEDMLIVDLRRV